MFKRIGLSLLVLCALYARAHSFHVGLAYADYDEKTGMLFCTLQLEQGDLSHWLENLNINFSLDELAKNQQKSTSWSHFNNFVQTHFSANTNKESINFQLFEIEIELDGRFFVYLYAENVSPFESITWKYSLLMGHSMEQQNKLEFKYIRNQKSQTFFAYFFETELSKTLIIKKD